GWVNAAYVKMTKNGRALFAIPEILALKQVPPTQPGEVNSSAVTPVALGDPNRIVGTIINVDAGRNVQLRRTPGIDGESLSLIPAGATVTVLSQTEIKLKGAVGEPPSPIWLLVRFDTESGSITGWI